MVGILEIFVGRLGKKPDLRYTKNLTPVCYLAVAVNSTITKIPEWKKVIVWGKQAELCPLYLKKGNEIFIQGETYIKKFSNKVGKQIEYEEVTAKLIGFSNI